MRTALILTLGVGIWMMSTAGAYAQEHRGYVQGATGLSTITGDTTANTNAEVGIKVAPRVVLFGNIGRMRDTGSASLQTSVDDAVNALAANNDLTATGTVHVPAWYTLGGARIDLSNKTRITPYVSGGVGFARLNPSVKFMYQGGTTLTGNSATVGDDITSDVVSSGVFTTPATQTALMMRIGGGVQVPLGRYLLGNVGYSVSRISADTPFHAQDLSFGVGIKF